MTGTSVTEEEDGKLLATGWVTWYSVPGRDKHSFSNFYYQLMYNRSALKGVLKFTLKQHQHVSV
jgi:hypothetical protein